MRLGGLRIRELGDLGLRKKGCGFAYFGAGINELAHI